MKDDVRVDQLKYEPLKIHVDKAKGTSEGITSVLNAITKTIEGNKGTFVLKLSLEDAGLLVVRKSVLLENAKTLAQLFHEYDEWKKTFRDGAMGNQEAYAKARDARPYFESGKWVRVSDLEAKQP